jgi:hypothetical protein
MPACVGELGAPSGDARGAPPPFAPNDPPATIPPGYAPGELVPVEGAMHRLTNAEYDRTVRDLFGADYDASARHRFQSDDLVDGYSRMLTTLAINPDRVGDYRDAAETIARDAIGSREQRVALMGCDVETDGEPCLRAFLGGAAARIWRRPLQEEEIERLVALGALAEIDGALDRAVLALEAMLQSPSFLFRIEVGRGEGPARALTGYERASRLSYSLFGSTPDLDLLERAASGQLDTTEGVERAVRVMLADDRARIGVADFVDGWLRLSEMERAASAAGASGEPIEETRRVVAEHMWGEDTALTDVFTTRSTWITPALAEIYGIEGAHEGWSAHELAPDAPRSGILTHPSFLGYTARDGRFVGVPRRGKFVRELFLCLPALTLPGSIELPTPDPEQSLVDFWQPIEASPGCAGCHGAMNPTGHVFDRYDSDGRYRESDEEGRPLTDEGAVVVGPPSAPTTIPVRGVAELGAYLASSPEVARCVVSQVHRYVHGRAELPRDAAHVDEVARSFGAAGGRFTELLVAFFTSEAFLAITAPEPIPSSVELGAIAWED